MEKNLFGNRLITIRGWTVIFQSPVNVLKPTPKNWRCRTCNKLMRFGQTTRRGYCPKCGGVVRREVKDNS